MSLAERIAQRYRQRVADSFGDPKALLAGFKQAVAKYSEKEQNAKNYLAAFAEVERLKTQGATAEEIQAARERGMQESFVGLRDKVVKRDLSYDVTTHAAQHGWEKIKEAAQNLCYAILQQLALPPKFRKSVEAIAKFYARTPRANPRGKTYEESLAKRVQLYLDFLEDFRKQEKVFDVIIAQGKQHSSEGEGATQLKAGPFTLVNTGGFSPEQMQNIAKLAAEAAQKMEGIGLGKVCYGEVLLTNRIDRPDWAAFYVIAKDEMFVRADSKVTMDAVRVICHELTHRLEHKFIPEKRTQIGDLYRTIKTHSFVSKTEMPHIGDTVAVLDKFLKSLTLKVTDYDSRRQSVKLVDANPPECFACAAKGKNHHENDAEHDIPIKRSEYYTMPFGKYFALKGEKQNKDPLDFITAYANKGGPGENFAEMVSFYAIGKLPKEQLDLLLPLLG
jgi:hypothetical protein